MSILGKLTEGIVRRDLSKDGEALLNKWEQTGLLEGLDDYNRNAVAVLLENQAKELLREATSMQAGDVEGFAAVAFPIVRRVFGSLVAQELVSVQPMSLPSGLIFFLDFTAQAPADLAATKFRDDLLAADASEPSVYGGSVVAKGIQGGVDLATDETGPAGMRNLKTGMTSARQAVRLAAGQQTAVATDTVANFAAAGAGGDALRKLIRFDADVLNLTSTDRVLVVDMNLGSPTSAANHPLVAATPATAVANMAEGSLMHLAVHEIEGVALAADHFEGNSGVPRLVRRLTQRLTNSAADGGTYAATLRLVFTCTPTGGIGGFAGNDVDIEFAVADNIAAGGAIGSTLGATAWEMESSASLPEINIKVDSLAVTAETRKLKATWTPELAQDLNAYHNLDAEVELTGLLSEQIALEIDSEILGDLLTGAKAGKIYWSRTPGQFVNRETGAVISGGDFTGTVSEWYETLIESVNDISADIHRKTLRGGANFVVCGPEVANILEFTAGFRANVTADSDMGMVGAMKSGSLSKKFDVYVTHAFPRNVLLVGRKGGSFLESGYVYAPYVPLQVTPTIFDPDTFVPRKAVMTRYGKKMVRPDMYGLVIVRDLV